MIKRSLLPLLATAALLAAQDKPAVPSAAPAAAKAAEPAPKEEPKLPEGLKIAMEAAQKGDFDAAVKALKSEADKGNGDAMNALGEFAMAGRGMKASPTEALKWFQKGADANHARCQFNLARMLLAGIEGVPKDDEKAEFLLKAAAESGLGDAQFLYGSRLEKSLVGDGKGPAPNLAEPRKWLEKGAAQKHADSLLALARYSDEGLAGEKSLEKGTEYTLQAAQAGSVVAMNEMGVRYQKGKGVRADNVAALGWFLAASEVGLAAAQVNLGNCYETGNGVPRNFDRAGSHYAAAAKQNYAPAQFLLGRLFENGAGTDKNEVYAYVNYFRAAAGGVKDAEAKRNELKAKLSAAQLKEAEALLAGKTEAEAKKPDAKPAEKTKKK